MEHVHFDYMRVIKGDDGRYIINKIKNISKSSSRGNVIKDGTIQIRDNGNIFITGDVFITELLTNMIDEEDIIWVDDYRWFHDIKKDPIDKIFKDIINNNYAQTLINHRVKRPWFWSKEKHIDYYEINACTSSVLLKQTKPFKKLISQPYEINYDN